MYTHTCSQENQPIVFLKKNQNASHNTKGGSSLDYEQARTLKLSQCDDEPIHEKKTTLDTRKLIQSTRQSLKLSQKDLACKLNVNTSVVNELESGKMKSPPPHLIRKLNNVLNLKIKLVT